MTPSKLALPTDRSTAEALAVALDSILRYAAEQAARIDEDPATAVHEYRKAVRRARSVVRLARAAASRRSLRGISVELRDAHRASSSLRDAEILLDAIELAGVEKTGALLDAVSQHRSEELVTDRIRAILERQTDLPERVVGAFREALPPDADVDDLLEGLRKTYGQARRELARASKVPDPAHIHNWRKRNKDVVYQLELLIPVLRKRAVKFRENLAALSKQLGQVMDLFVLRRFLRGEPGLEELANQIDALAQKKFSRARKRGKSLYKHKPKKLAKRLRARRTRRGE